jgi:uncharacterized protein
MSVIFWDSMLFIYWFEQHPEHGKRIGQIYRRMRQRGDSLATSALNYGEVLVGSSGSHDQAALARMKDFFREEVQVLPFNASAVESFVHIRRNMRLKVPDAINLACAASAGVDVFITHDKQLAGKVIPGIQFIVPLYNELF